MRKTIARLMGLRTKRNPIKRLDKTNVYATSLPKGEAPFIDNGYLYHGGCLQCDRYYNGQQSRCPKCKYHSANWTLPDLRIKEGQYGF